MSLRLNVKSHEVYSNHKNFVKQKIIFEFNEIIEIKVKVSAT